MAQYSAAVSEILTKTSGVLVLCGTFPVVLCPANPSLLCLSEFSESTMLSVGFPSLSSSLQSEYKQKSKGILGFTSFVFPFVGVIVLYCLSTNVSEWLIHTFLSTFLVLWVGGYITFLTLKTFKIFNIKAINIPITTQSFLPLALLFCMCVLKTLNMRSTLLANFKYTMRYC